MQTSFLLLFLLFVCLFVCFRGRIFALKLHARTTVPASRDLQENDIDVYVRPDTPARIVKKVTLKMIEINSVFNFNIMADFFRGFDI